MDADSLVASDAHVVTSLIPGGADVSSGGGVMIDGNTIEITLAEIRMGVENQFDLTRFNSRYTPVMDHRGVTLTEYRAAGRNGSDVFEYLSYGGWLTESAFSVDMLTINDGSDDESSLIVGISYGEESGSKPTGTGVANWNGPAVGVHKDSGDVIQGHAGMTILNVATESSVDINFINLRNLSNGDSIDNMGWINVPIGMDGTFSSTTSGDIDGVFYGMGHTEVGGTFNRDGIIGAFGGTRE